MNDQMLREESHGADPLEATMVECSRSDAAPRGHRLVSVPLLAALRRAGTSHVYADTADVTELASLVAADDGGVVAEIDGNTANQPLVRKALSGYLDQRLADCAENLADRAHAPAEMRRALLYALVCGRIGNDVIAAVAAGRAWEVSLQLHMDLGADVSAARRVGRHLRRMVPTAFVKVPFTPHAPECFIVARDLEREGIPVNLTSTFSARQAAAAALLTDVTRTNVFMGRLDEGLEARLLGAHVVLEAQRTLRRLRREVAVKTQLIVASMRAWHTFVETAGCDVYTAPCAVVRDFLAQIEIGPRNVASRLETSYEDRLGVAERTRSTLGAERIARLYRVEPDLIAFLREFGSSEEWRGTTDGEALYRRFDAAGFADLFHAPSGPESTELRRRKLPDLDSPLTARLPLDTLYSLLADADFENHQEAIDREIGRHVSHR